ncbi:MAG: rRNA pseudouridine synthase [Planctomycetes bacterium]|nr:rRNA pseudouridine synthase [Planctomycetota bacterium]
MSKQRSNPPPGRARINKVLANAGVASRRGVEEMIGQGRVTVNGQLVVELPCFVDLAADRVCVDGRHIRPARAGVEDKVYFLLNKPRGVVCTQRDEAGRPRVVDLLPEIPQRVYPVGRLDVETTGLIVVTNDGELTDYLTHPRYGVVKTYVAEVVGFVEADHIEAVRRGVYLDGRRTQGAGVKVLRRNRKRTLLEIRLREGRNREVRRMLTRLGYKVTRLKRVAIGAITDRGLKIGSFRKLRPAEVARLRRSGEKPTTSAARPAPRTRAVKPRTETAKWPTKTTKPRAKRAQQPTDTGKPRTKKRRRR